MGRPSHLSAYQGGVDNMILQEMGRSINWSTVILALCQVKTPGVTLPKSSINDVSSTREFPMNLHLGSLCQSEGCTHAGRRLLM